MKSAGRLRYLLEKATKNNFVSIPDSARELQVSVETIRRDINILCNQKKLKKVHGGAVPIHTPIRKDPAYQQRFQLNPKGRAAAATAAAALIRNGDVVAIDNGATTDLMAQHITGVENVTFVVNSLRVANVLADKLESGEISGTLILIGGALNLPSRSTQDAYALDSLEPFRFDIAFISASAVSADGVANAGFDGNRFIRKLMQHSASSILVADSEKLGCTSTYRFAMPTDFDRIFVDDLRPVPQDLLDLLEGSDTQLIVAPI